MDEKVEITAFDSVASETIEFRIKIPKNTRFYMIFDVDLQQRLSDAINRRDKVAYIDSVEEIVRRMEAKSGKTEN